VTADPLGVYLSEIDRTPLLSPEEEREVAFAVLAGDPEARDRMARANLRLVVSIARQYARKYTNKGVSLADLIAQGNLGLLRAMESFDPDTGRFSTYAALWVKQSIRANLPRTRHVVAIPVYANHLVGLWARAEDALRDRLGRPPEADEVAAEMRLTRRQRAVVDRARKAVASAGGVGVASWPADDSDAERYPAATRPPDEAAEAADAMRFVLSRLGDLDDRSRAVLALRYGLADGRERTLADVGREMGLTRERVRQIERDAIVTLRRWASA
jgi:RNA polymerase primary sigma factor